MVAAPAPMLYARGRFTQKTQTKNTMKRKSFGPYVLKKHAS